MASRKLIVQIIGDSSSLEKSFGRIESRSDRLNRRLKTGAKAGLAGLAVGGAAVLTKQTVNAVNAAKDAEKANFRLRNSYKQVGGTAKQFATAQKQIAKVSKEAALDDEDLSDSLAAITRTTGSTSKGLKGMALAANIARARNISLAAATKIVEKAHVRQLRGLKGIGVQIDKNTTSSQALERAQKKFAGAGAEFGQTSAAAQERLSVAFENLQETVGAKLLPVLQRLAIRLTEIIENVEKNWPRISKVIEDTVTVLRPIVNVIARQAKGIANVIAGVVKTIKAIANGDWSKAWEGIKQVAIDGMLEIIKAAAELPLKVVKALGSQAWEGLKSIGTTIKDAALSGLNALGDAIVNRVQEAINRLIRLLNNAIGKLNKVPLLPNIPKLPELGGQTGNRGGPQQQGVRTVPATTNATIVVPVVIDGKEVARVTKVWNERDAISNPAQKRGGNWRR